MTTLTRPSGPGATIDVVPGLAALRAVTWIRISVLLLAALVAVTLYSDAIAMAGQLVILVLTVLGARTPHATGTLGPAAAAEAITQATVPTPGATSPATEDARVTWSLRLGIVALIVGWVPLIGWLIGAPLMLTSTILAVIAQFTTGQTPRVRKALLINVAAGVLLFLSVWLIMALGADATTAAATASFV